MANLFDRINDCLKAATESLLNSLCDISGIIFVLLIPVGLLLLIFGLKIYRIALVFFFMSIGALAGYLISGNIAVSVASSILLAALAALFKVVFMIVFTAGVFGIITFSVMVPYFQGFVSLFSAAVFSVIMIIVAIKLFKLAIILATSASGSALAVISVLILKEQRRLFADVNLEKIKIDKIQFFMGFAALFILGAVIQGIVCGMKSKKS